MSVLGVTRQASGPSRANFPYDLLVKVFEYVPVGVFVTHVQGVCKEFSLEWCLSNAKFDNFVLVPDQIPTLNAAINSLAHRNGGGQGLVLVRPGVYQESVRITQNCHILGLGRRGRVVVEAPGWESALVSAGLGGAAVPDLPGWDASMHTGEDATVENLTFRCRNEQMVGRCVYLVMGRLHLVRCDVYGGVHVSGFCTAPRFTECRVLKSRGSGFRLTDHSKASLRRNQIRQHRLHGILVDRHSEPEISDNEIRGNKSCGIRLFIGGGSRAGLALSDAVQGITGNHFIANEGAELSLTPRYASSEGGSDEEVEALLAGAIQGG